MEIAIAALVGACLLAAALLGFRRTASASAGAGARDSAAVAAARAGQRSCPLCASVLGAGERVKSSLYPGKADRIMHIYGCAHCWPVGVSSPAGVSSLAPRRICPVCGRELEAEGWVVARYFERRGPAGLAAKGHIHVLGCTGCRG